jgi:hypothetical protein
MDSTDGGKAILRSAGVHNILTCREIPEVRHLILKTFIDVHRKKQPWAFDAAKCNIKFLSSGTVSVASDSRSSGTRF